MDLLEYYDHLIILLKTNQKLQKRATGTFRTFVFGATGTILGATLAGPAGAVFGGMLGSALGYRSGDKNKPLIDALDKLSYPDKVRLAMQVQALVRGTTKEDLNTFIENEQRCAVLLHLLESAKSSNN